MLLDGAQQDARRVALFALSASDAAQRAVLVDETSARLRARPEDLPRWALVPMAAASNEGLRDLAAVARALRAHVLPGAGPGAAEAVHWPFGASDAQRPWLDAPRRAGVWSRDASGDHALLLEEPHGAVGLAAVEPASRPWPRRLLIFGAESREALASALVAAQGRAAAAADWHAFADEIDHFEPGRYRAAVLVRDAADLDAKIVRLLQAIRSTSTSLHTPDGAHFGDITAATGRTAFVFPGQGAQYVGMLGDLCLDARAVQTWYEQLQETFPPDDECPPSMLVAPPTAGLRPEDRRAIDRGLQGVSRGAMATLVGSLAVHELLARIGLRADAMAGYSNGENAALVASGAWRLNGLEQLFGLMYVMRTHDEDHHVEPGACLAVNRASPELIDAALAAGAGQIYVALENCPEQAVLFGAPDRIRQASERLTAGGAFCVPLAFNRGHHTPVYGPTVVRLKPLYAALEIGPPTVPLYSAITAAPFPHDPAEMRDLASSQWARARTLRRHRAADV